MYKQSQVQSSQISPLSTFHFSGKHDLINNSFIINDNKFIIKKRKNCTSEKSARYICAITPFCYISSLYEKEDGKVIMEYKGQYFQVLFTIDSIEFRRSQTRF